MKKVSPKKVGPWALQFLTWVGVGAALASPAPRDVQPQQCAEAPSESMVQIPAGSYQPFFRNAAREPGGAMQAAPPVAVPAFQLDPAPVTRGEYLAFVCRHPAWRKSQVRALFAEPAYLADWPDDLDANAARLSEPVTHVSWFAARAYCAARNARLPTVIEWERVAGASGSADLASEPARDASMPFKFAMGRVAQDLRPMRLQFPGIWEWNADFNSAPAAGGGSAQGRKTSSLFCADGYRATNARDYAAFLRHSLRSSLRASYTLKNLGFRCAKEE